MRNPLDKSKNMLYNMSNTHRKEKGMKLKELLKEKGITQGKLANELGVHQTLISQWCHGKCKPNVIQVAALARIIGVGTQQICDCFQE